MRSGRYLPERKKRMYMRRFLIIVGFLIPLVVSAQQSFKIDVKQLNMRIVENVVQLNDFIVLMSDQNKTMNVRNAYRSKALDFFIGKGNPYEDYVVGENGLVQKVQNNGVLIEVSTQFRRKPTQRLVRDFFTSIINLRFKPVDIVGVEMISEIDEGTFHKISNDLYVVSGWTEQSFNGYKEGKPVYKDFSRKKRNIYLRVIITEKGEIIDPLLGDVIAIEQNKVQ